MKSCILGMERMMEAFEREFSKEKIEYLEAKLKECKDINGGITTENIKLVEKNARLRKAGKAVIQLWDEIEKYVEIEKACTDAGWMAGYFSMVDRMAELREACDE